MIREVFYADVTELSIVIHDYKFLCLVGNHVNGGWCAFINWGVTAELSNQSDEQYYNKCKILSAIKNSPSAWIFSDCEEVLEKIAWKLSKIITKHIVELKEMDPKLLSRCSLAKARSVFSEAHTAMNIYYLEHGTCKEDNDIYSQDPEWQQLNENLSEAMNELEIAKKKYGEFDP